MFNQEDAPYDINLLNKVSGVSYPRASVYGANTLGQILQEYAEDIGIDPESRRISHENKRTGASTSDSGETVSGLELIDGDVLVFADDGDVASKDESGCMMGTSLK